MLYLASDHGGVKKKAKIVEFLNAIKHDFVDLGPTEIDPKDDFPNFAIPAMKRFMENPTENKVVLLCKNGVGVSILANKYVGARCALSWNEKHIESARNDDDVNVLAIPAEYVDIETAKNLVSLFIRTPFAGEERFVRRLKEISELEL